MVHLVNILEMLIELHAAADPALCCSSIEYADSERQILLSGGCKVGLKVYARWVLADSSESNQICGPSD